MTNSTPLSKNGKSNNVLRPIFWDTHKGIIVPTIFTNYVVIPSREEFERFVAAAQYFYDTHSDEDIKYINANAEAEWYQETYPSDAKPAFKVVPGYVYLVQSSTGHYKIGRTKNPDNRLRTFGVQLPFEVEYVCVIETEDMYNLESELHHRYAKQRVNGEWFQLAPGDVEYIKGLAS